MASNGRRKPHRGITEDDEMMLRVVTDMFSGGAHRSCREVAEAQHITPQAVVALVERAQREGLITTLVLRPREQIEVARLEGAVRSQYGLQKVLLVPGDPDILQDLDQRQRRSIQRQVLHSMAQRFAEYFDTLLVGAAARQRAAIKAGREAAPFVVGVAWGRTMHLLARHLLSTPRPLRLAELHVVPIVGITSALRADPVEANVVAMDVARAYGGLSAQLPCPAFVVADEAGVVTQTRQVRRMLAKIRTDCEVVVSAMGPIPETASAMDITVSPDPVSNEELFNAARHAGAIGEICYWLFGRDGKEVRASYKSLGLGFEGLRQIAADPKRQVVLVTGGDRWRFEPLKVALRAGLASVLVSDTVTARYLVDEPGSASAGSIAGR